MFRMVKELVGATFGEFTVLRRSQSNKKYYVCECKKGHVKRIRRDHLFELPICQECKKHNDHIGDVINGITILEYIRSDKYNNKYYKVRCFCGKEFISIYSSIHSGHTKSCGCLVNKYGDLSKDTRYTNWLAMVKRVTNPNNKAYDHYHSLIHGKVIEEDWVKSPENFYKEIGDKPDSSYTIDRIDNSLGYVKGNVKWSTHQEQQLNRTTKRGATNRKYIYYDKRRYVYVAYSYVPKGKNYIGQFKRLEDAIKAQREYNS